MVGGGIDVVGELDLDDGPQTVRSHADRHADEAAFGDRGVKHALDAELVHQPCCGAEYPGRGIRADSTHEDVGIELHGLAKRGIDRLREAQRRAPAGLLLRPKVGRQHVRTVPAALRIEPP